MPVAECLDVEYQSDISLAIKGAVEETERIT